jgi:hypothetical protein
MPNHLKHIAVKNFYYSGNTFGSASIHHSHQNMYSSRNGFIFNTRVCLYTRIGYEVLL